MARKQIHQKVRILGHGAVVRAFLMNASAQFPNFQFTVYCRGQVSSSSRNVCFKPVEELTTEEGSLFYCCSTVEEQILANSSTPSSRLSVAQANLKIAAEYISAGSFNQGQVFVLTNPSELIAEEIRFQSGNPFVFALGLSVDRNRYKHLLTHLACPYEKEFSMGGNHYDRPCPVLSEHSIPNRHALDILHEKFSENVRVGFTGHRPPIDSGVSAIADAISALSLGKDLPVSGYDTEQECFVGGSLDLKTLTFRSTLASTQELHSLFSEITERHKHNMFQFGVGK